MKNILFLLLFFLSFKAIGQKLPFQELPEDAGNYTAGTVAARTVDGLGFRFYWATDGLVQKDLDYRPNPNARSVFETIQHIYAMSFIIVNATTGVTNTLENPPVLKFDDMRQKTLENLKLASDNLKLASDQEIQNFKAVFKRGESSFELPFWNILNGPLSDCLWHTGQIVSFRRSSGNPFSDKVNLFTGKVADLK